MKEALRDKIQTEIMLACWRDIKDLLARNPVFEVFEEPLIDIGYAIATDQVAQIQAWLDSGVLSRVVDIEACAKSEGQHHHILIIKPYVLIKVVDES